MARSRDGFTDMDWDKLKVFHAAAEAGSFTHAGEQLGLSQSAVSRQVSALEQELAVSLFHRHARGLICAPLPGERGPYLKALPGYRRDREKLLNEYKVPELQARWEEKMRRAYAKPGEDAEFDFWITSMSAARLRAIARTCAGPRARTPATP